MELNQRICIITGGGSGIGKATAIALASEGAIVHLVGRTLSKLESVKQIIERTAGKSFTHSVDISDEAGTAPAEAWGPSNLFWQASMLI